MTELPKIQLRELEQLGRRVTAYGGGGVCEISGEELLSLIVAARELAELKSAMTWLCKEKDAQVTASETEDTDACFCTEPASILEAARHLGWKP